MSQAIGSLDQGWRCWRGEGLAESDLADPSSSQHPRWNPPLLAMLWPSPEGGAVRRAQAARICSHERVGAGLLRFRRRRGRRQGCLQCVPPLLLSAATDPLLTALETSSSTPTSFTPTFKLAYTVHLTSTQLAVSLRVSSPTFNPCPLRFQALLHSYLRLPSGITPPQVRVTPLGGLEYIDKVLGGVKAKEERAVVEVDGPAGEVDRVYLGAPASLEVSYADASGGMECTKTGLTDVVVSGLVSQRGTTGS